jgi:catechol 2,3-dioxygenase-like lactoylglutathione lyase family enzyme
VDEDGGVSTKLTVVGLDHLVINSTDVERSLAFYCDRLGLQPERVAEWRQGVVPFPSVRVNDSTIIDLLATDRTGENFNHFCLTVEPADFEAVKAEAELDVVEGPAVRFGARGNGTSLYIRDPDANVVELRYYDR